MSSARKSKKSLLTTRSFDDSSILKNNDTNIFASRSLDDLVLGKKSVHNHNASRKIRYELIQNRRKEKKLQLEQPRSVESVVTGENPVTGTIIVSRRINIVDPLQDIIEKSDLNEHDSAKILEILRNKAFVEAVPELQSVLDQKCDPANGKQIVRKVNPIRGDSDDSLFIKIFKELIQKQDEQLEEAAAAQKAWESDAPWEFKFKQGGRRGSHKMKTRKHRRLKPSRRYRKIRFTLKSKKIRGGFNLRKFIREWIFPTLLLSTPLQSALSNVPSSEIEFYQKINETMALPNRDLAYYGDNIIGNCDPMSMVGSNQVSVKKGQDAFYQRLLAHPDTNTTMPHNVIVPTANYVHPNRARTLVYNMNIYVSTAFLNNNTEIRSVNDVTLLLDTVQDSLVQEKQNCIQHSPQLFTPSSWTSTVVNVPRHGIIGYLTAENALLILDNNYITDYVLYTKYGFVDKQNDAKCYITYKPPSGYVSTGKSDKVQNEYQRIRSMVPVLSKNITDTASPHLYSNYYIGSDERFLSVSGTGEHGISGNKLPKGYVKIPNESYSRPQFNLQNTDNDFNPYFDQRKNTMQNSKTGTQIITDNSVRTDGHVSPLPTKPNSVSSIARMSRDVLEPVLESHPRVTLERVISGEAKPTHWNFDRLNIPNTGEPGARSSTRASHEEICGLANDNGSKVPGCGN